MIKKVNQAAVGLCLLFLLVPLHAQTVSKMEFHNQKITDILLVLADSSGCSIIPDETVQGTATFYFSDSDIETALDGFLHAYGLYYEKRNSAYYVSKIRIKLEKDNGLTVDAEDVDIRLLTKYISRVADKTILYDQLPSDSVTIHTSDTALPDLLAMLIKKYTDYTISDEKNCFYIKKTRRDQQGRTVKQKDSLTEKDGLFSVSVEKIHFADMINNLFKTAGKEYVLLSKNNAELDKLSYDDKTFDQMLQIVLNLGSADFFIKDSVYYIFEIQKNDVLKNFKETAVIKLKYVDAQNVVNLLPANSNAAGMIKIDKNTNTLYITGSREETQSILSFIAVVDQPVEDKYYKRFDVKYLAVKDLIPLIPEDYLYTPAVVIPGINAFVTLVSKESADKLDTFIAMTDKKQAGTPIHLRYIKSSDLLKYLPPSISKDNITITGNDNLVFFTGTEDNKNRFLKELDIIDKPVPQIRYELLVVEYQKSATISYSNTFTVSPTSSSPSFSVNGKLSNLLDVSFDVISQFGYEFALELNDEIGKSNARILADTTLNALSGQEVKFENTNTYRYRENSIDPNKGDVLYTTTTREITSGLTIDINGWISGDEMITMNVTADISKQGEDNSTTSTTNPPPTSEKSVTTHTRTSSGTPVVLGGLLQTDTTKTIKKIPILGSIPVIGRLFQQVGTSDDTTDMVIYIVPHSYTKERESTTIEKNIDKFYRTYVLGE